VIRGILELLRPANVMTALADVLAGFAVGGLLHREALPWLLGATACLYAGGVVLNDVFDRDIDRVERPERPIPSGRVPIATAAALGGSLLAAGVLFASQATRLAAGIAIAIAAFVLVYDAWGKRHAVAPLNMGLCRALNLLLGMAAVPAIVERFWPLAFIPLVYIAGVTTLSRGEVRGGTRHAALLALLAVFAALLALASVAIASDQRVAGSMLTLAAVWRIAPPFWKAWQLPEPGVIRAAVKRGVLSLVLIDAAIGAAFAGPVYAALVLATAVVAGWLARRFAVT
jgi:4-hydroxybenzoate polyprenyltransferase